MHNLLRALALSAFQKLPVDIQFACACRWAHDNGHDLTERRAWNAETAFHGLDTPAFLRRQAD